MNKLNKILGIFLITGASTFSSNEAMAKHTAFHSENISSFFRSTQQYAEGLSYSVFSNIAKLTSLASKTTSIAANCFSNVSYYSSYPLVGIGYLETPGKNLEELSTSFVSYFANTLTHKYENRVVDVICKTFSVPGLLFSTGFYTVGFASETVGCLSNSAARFSTEKLVPTFSKTSDFLDKLSVNLENKSKEAYSHSQACFQNSTSEKYTFTDAFNSSPDFFNFFPNFASA
jgi:hypothetical protein